MNRYTILLGGGGITRSLLNWPWLEEFLGGCDQTFICGIPGFGEQERFELDLKLHGPAGTRVLVGSYYRPRSMFSSIIHNALRLHVMGADIKRSRIITKNVNLPAKIGTLVVSIETTKPLRLINVVVKPVDSKIILKQHRFEINEAENGPTS